MAEVERRRAARVLVVDGAGRVLLFSGGDPAHRDRGSWWFTAGGGIEPGEAPEEAARREVFEEAGLRLGELGPVVAERSVTFEFDDRLIEQDEVFFLARVDGHEVSDAGWTELERRAMTGHRWWSLAELEATTERVYPEGLAELLRGLGSGGGGED